MALQPGPSIGVELRREDGDVHGSGEPGFAAGGPCQTYGERLIAEEPVGAPNSTQPGRPPETIHLGGESPTETPLIEDHSQPTENADFEPPRVLRRMVE